MIAPTQQLPAEVERYIDRFVARRRMQRLLRAVARAILFTIIWTLAWCIVDRLIALGATMRMILLGAHVAVIAVILLRAAVVLLRRVDVNAAAAQIERREPVLSQRLRTIASRLTSEQHCGASAELLDALSRQVADQVRDRDPTRLLPWRRVLRPAAACAAWLTFAAALSFSSWLDLPTLLRRYAMPLSNIRPVTTTRLIVNPGDADIAQGEPLRVQASAIRLATDRPLTLHVRARDGESIRRQTWHDEPMTAHLDGRFEAQIARVDRDLEYFVTGGDARSDIFHVTMLPRPAVRRFRIRYVYPPHTKLAPREVESQTGAIEAPVGTEVTLTLEPTHPLRYAVLTIGAESIRITPAAGSADVASNPAAASTTFTVQNDRRYTLRMVSDRGVSGIFRGGSVRAIPDRAPIAQFDRFGAEPRSAGAEESVPVGYQVVDDYGLARLDLDVRVIRKSGAEANASIPVPLSSGVREQRGVLPLELQRFGLNAGDEIELRLQAEDRAGQFALSRAVRLAISPAPVAPPPPHAEPLPAPTAMPPPDESDTPPLDPEGYGDAIRAYFDALRRTLPATQSSQPQINAEDR